MEKNNQNEINEKLIKPYNPRDTEENLYKLWEENGFFKPENSPNEKGEIFSMVLPPPNVTGVLHMGHAAMLAVEDIMVRYKRMSGYKTLWIPGTDHASIATQSKVEGIIYKKEKKTRHDLGREELLKRVVQFAQESHDTIVGQVRKIGSSIDWSREAYTLDDQRNLAVKTAFKKMYNNGLIYRGSKIVNWDPKMKTTVSDDEIERVEEKTNFYYLKYGPFIIGTSRPETKFGDKYVVMHPNDKRYERYESGQKIDLEWINGPITATIVKDEAVDMDFGTGVMTITPWHDTADFEIAERHNLDKDQVIDENGILLPIAGEFAGQHIKKARPLIIEKLQQKGLVEKIDENYIHNIATNSRGGGIIEPQIKKQWFVDVNKKFKMDKSNIEGIESGQETTLKEIMQKAVSGGQIEIMPDRFEKVYFHWINNLRDWCISRQLWYGHRIPVWYKDSQEYCDINPPEEPGWEQDPDTLDTWFSSGLWTFSTLGWPEKTDELKIFHPTSILETGYDILFFWVARMILMSGYLLGEIPFKKVYLHGLVRDAKGQKMSKSLGNIIDPLEMIDKYGADATRMSLIIGAPPGNDVRLAEDKIKGYKHFANKIWNASRFVLSNMEGFDFDTKPKLTEKNKKYLDDLEIIIKEVTEDMEAYKLYMAGEKLYHYFWHTFADVIIEESKGDLRSTDNKEKTSAQYTLFTILTTCLKALHPFIPFVTEEIWGMLPIKEKKMLIVESWPK